MMSMRKRAARNIHKAEIRLICPAAFIIEEIEHFAVCPQLAHKSAIGIEKFIPR